MYDVRRWCGLGLLLIGLGSADLWAQEPLAAADAGAAEIFRGTNSTAMVLVVVRDKETHLQTFGQAALGSGQVPGAASVVRLCSLTKIFATDLLLKLTLDGTVRLDDPLQRFAPAGVTVPVRPGSRPMTLGDLATHTAGLPREVGRAPAGTAHFTFPDHAQRWRWLPHQRLRTAAGDAALYSNIGFDLLGDALESAAHRPYAALLAERTTRPLAMRDTTFSPSPEQCSRLLRGTHYDGTPDDSPCTDTQASAGSAGLYSTPADMARWLQYLLGVSEIKQNGAAQAAYVQPSNLASVKGLDHAGEAAGMGLGWVILDAPATATRIVEKTGGGAGFTTYIALDQAHHTGLFLALTAGAGDWHGNPFKAANNLLLGLANLPPMVDSPRPAMPARRVQPSRHRRRHP